MKSILTTALSILLITALSLGQEINWMSMNEALELQAKNPKKIMMDVYTSWCGPCKMLDARTFGNADLASYVNDNFYAVKFNAEGNDPVNYQDNYFTNPGFDPKKTRTRNGTHQFTSYLQVSGYPTIVFFDEKSNLIVPLTGVLSVSQLELYLKMINQDQHTEIQTKEQFEEYQSTFVPEFKG